MVPLSADFCLLEMPVGMAMAMAMAMEWEVGGGGVCCDSLCNGAWLSVSTRNLAALRWECVRSPKCDSDSTVVLERCFHEIGQSVRCVPVLKHRFYGIDSFN